MRIEGQTILILGGSGLVGTAVARRLFEHRPATIVISALRREEAESAVTGLREEPGSEVVRFEAEWGDIFLPEPLKDRRRAELAADDVARAQLLDDLYGELTAEVVERSALGALLLRHRPDVVVDCVNTATVFAYQNVYESAGRLRERASADGVDTEAVERHLSTLYLPQLIRHVQVALEAMRRAGTGIYVKIGTSGTGGMGLNVPFTHSEERPSRMLLSKAGLAGAHTLLLFLMARTPDAPAVKEIKPTAAIAWKRIAHGEIRPGGRPIQRYDATRAVPLTEAFDDGASESFYEEAGGTLDGVFLDAGENGFFSRSEFETISSLGLMEFITPEEIAANVIREVQGHPTGRDVVAAVDGATSGPTYRAGVLRERALATLAALEEEHASDAVAYEMLGPPRLTKLLFEAAILGRLYSDLPGVARLEPEKTAERAAVLVQGDDDLRTRILSVGLPVLLPSGSELLRGPEIKARPRAGAAPDAAAIADQGWVDLRPANWRKWRERATSIEDELRTRPSAADGSRANTEPLDGAGSLRPGRLAAWILTNEDLGERIKR